MLKTPQHTPGSDIRYSSSSPGFGPGAAGSAARHAPSGCEDEGYDPHAMALPLHVDLLGSLADRPAALGDFWGQGATQQWPSDIFSPPPAWSASPAVEATALRQGLAPPADPLLRRLCRQMPCTFDERWDGPLLCLRRGPEPTPCWRVGVEALGQGRYRCAAAVAGEHCSFVYAAATPEEARFVAAWVHPQSAMACSAFRTLFPGAPPTPACTDAFNDWLAAALEAFARAPRDLAPLPAVARSSQSLRQIINTLMAEWTPRVGPINRYVMWHACEEGDNRASFISAINKRLKVLRKIYPAEDFPTTWTAVLELVDRDHLSSVSADSPHEIVAAFDAADLEIADLAGFYEDYGGKDWAGLIRHHTGIRKDLLAAAGLPGELASPLHRVAFCQQASALQGGVPPPSA